MLSKRIKKRIDRLLIGCLVIFALILGKLAWVQLIGRSDLFSKARDLWERDFPVAGLRGNLLDINNEVLATDIPSASVMVVPAQIEDPPTAARQLSDILETEPENILAQITRNVSTQRIVPWGRLITQQQAQAIEALNLSGVVLVQDSRRYYPNGAWLAQVLGFTGVDNQGLAGLELQYEDILKAQQGSMKIPFDAKGHPVKLYAERYEAPGQGMDIMLTIDSRIQDILERELNNAMERYTPQAAWGLAMNPNTGEILAMVSKPDFDPNHYQDYDESVYNRNLPVWMSYEPGSTFKTVTFAAALEAGLFDMEKDTYLDRGVEIVEGARLKSWKAGGHGLQTYMECLQNSSNPCFVHIAQMLGSEGLSTMLDTFGFGQKTGVDLPGESAGILFDEESWGLLEQSTTGFGQGISVTAIQLATAFSAIVNGGRLMQPYITKAILHPVTRDPIVEVKPKMIRQVISEQTSFKMRYALESVVALGGAKGAYIDGYRIGGKTGTAQKAINGTYLSGEYILSTIAAAPIDDPQIVVYIALDAPHSNVQYGGTVVSPIVRNVLEDVLTLYEVERTDDQMERVRLWSDPVVAEVPDYTGMQYSRLVDEHLKLVKVGDGDVVVDQLPQAGVKVDEQSTVWLYCPQTDAE